MGCSLFPIFFLQPFSLFFFLPNLYFSKSSATRRYVNDLHEKGARNGLLVEVTMTDVGITGYTPDTQSKSRRWMVFLQRVGG